MSRVLFAEIPDQAGKRMPKFGKFTASAEKRVDAIVERLMQMKDCYELDYLNNAIDDWLEQRRLDFCVPKTWRSKSFADVLRSWVFVQGWWLWLAMRLQMRWIMKGITTVTFVALRILPFG